MSIPMFLRSFHMPNWMDEELRILSFKTNMNKAELMRRMIAHGLDKSWDHLNGDGNAEPVLDNPVPERTGISAKAQQALGMIAQRARSAIGMANTG